MSKSKEQQKFKKDVEKARLEIKQKYIAEIEELKHYKQDYFSVKEENMQLKLKIEEMNSIIDSYNEWIERMLDYCNMSEEDLHAIKKDIKNKKDMSALFDGFMNFGDMLSKYWRI